MIVPIVAGLALCIPSLPVLAHLRHHLDPGSIIIMMGSGGLGKPTPHPVQFVVAMVAMGITATVNAFRPLYNGPTTGAFASLSLHDLCKVLTRDPYHFDGYSLIRCVILSELVCAWLHGAAGDGMTWQAILQHLEECDERHYTHAPDDKQEQP